MKILEANKEIFYDILHFVYNYLEVSPIAVEVGVLKGENAEKILDILKPNHLYLIDSWNVNAFEDYLSVNADRSWVNDLTEYSFYFGGDITSQETFDALFAKVEGKFYGHKNVTILRHKSLQGAFELKSLAKNKINFAYIDASHQFETVLDDLLAYYPLLDPDYGCIQLNDCCFSDLGNKQNLGVLEAAVRFCKMVDFVPIALVNRPWTDILLAHKNSRMVKIIDEVIAGSSIPFVGVPNSLLGSLTIKQGKERGNVCFE